jgi:tRNA A58 N-methylase Trm61
LWGFLKDTVYKNNPHTIEEIKEESSAAVISVSEETLAAVVRNFRRRLQMVLDADCAYIENVCS